MNINHYDKKTGEYISSSIARPDPRDEGKFLLPAAATKKPIPAVLNNQAAFFIGGEWVIKQDFRGVRYWIKNNNGIKISNVDITVPVYATTTPPPALDSVLDDGGWRNKTAQEIDMEKDARADNLIQAFALVILNEINVLRVQTGLPERTAQQLKAAVKAKL